ncbi:MAG: helix-turn-helix domain-containing protein [Caldilineaceae bacterium]|nr:helix-turn-helix domain-containing protein [Caldilineaceae bacterium]
MAHTLSAPQAAEVVGVDHSTLFRWVADGLLPAERVGIQRRIMIDPDDLRNFARTHNYPFDERTASELSQ